jgi:deoxyribodipyrimidine photo-lyase
LVKKGKTWEVWQLLLQEFDIKEVFFNKDYEPYAIKRDLAIGELLESNKTACFSFKDQVIFEEKEITKADGFPYTVFTPYKNKWLEQYKKTAPLQEYDITEKFYNFHKSNFTFPTLEQIGFEESSIKVIPHNLKNVSNYHETRDFPALDSTTHLSPHLRFGTVSIRKLVNWAANKNEVFLSELIWREFFMQILGIVMGTNLAPILAHTYMAMLEEELYIVCKNKNIKWPEMFKRFIDDGFEIIKSNKKQFSMWGHEFNNLRENIF